MSLKVLFNDKKCRQYITECVDMASENGYGVCDCCGNSEKLMKVNSKNLCMECTMALANVAEDYNTVLVSVNSDNMLDYISEGFVYPKLSALKKEAKTNFNGSIPNLMQTNYGITLNDKDWDIKLKSDKKIKIPTQALQGGTKFNKFMIDYDCAFDSVRNIKDVVADADGTMCVFKIRRNGVTETVDKNGNVLSSTQKKKSKVAKVNMPKTPAGVKTVASQPSSNATSNVSVVGKGSQDNFVVKLSKDSEMKVMSLGNTNNIVSYELTLDNVVNTDSFPSDKVPSIKEYTKQIINDLINNPSKYFKAFEGISGNEIVISANGTYTFKFDNNSFDGKEITMIDIASKERVTVSKKALSNQIILKSELITYINDTIRKKYPILLDGNNKVRTSVGTVIFDLLELNRKDIKLEISTPLVRQEEVIKAGDLEGTVDEGKIALKAFLYNNLGVLVRDFDDAVKSQSKNTYLFTTQNYKIEFTIDENEFYDSGKIIFDIAQVFDSAKNEVADNVEPMLYSDSKEPLSTFMNKIIFKAIDNNTMSTANDKMSDSAVNKLKNPSRKIAFLYKLAQILKDKLIDALALSDVIKGALDINFTSFDINKDGKPIKVDFTIADSDNAISKDSSELFDILNLKDLKWCVADSHVNQSLNQINVRVTDINAFSDFIDLSILESFMLRAFNITKINESANINIRNKYIVEGSNTKKRKTIFAKVNESMFGTEIGLPLDRENCEGTDVSGISTPTGSFKREDKLKKIICPKCKSKNVSINQDDKSYYCLECDNTWSIYKKVK